MAGRASSRSSGPAVASSTQKGLTRGTRAPPDSASKSRALP